MTHNEGVETLTLDTWVSLAAIAAGFAGVTGYLRSALLDIRDEMVALRTELKSDIAGCRSELKGDIAGLRTAVATLDDRVYNLNTSVTGLLTRETHRSQTG